MTHREVRQKEIVAAVYDRRKIALMARVVHTSSLRSSRQRTLAVLRVRLVKPELKVQDGGSAQKAYDLKRTPIALRPPAV